jgi:hypothetical protein
VPGAASAAVMRASAITCRSLMEGHRLPCRTALA